MHAHVYIQRELETISFLGYDQLLHNLKILVFLDWTEN
jgi:hypothetical protein